MTLNPRLGLLLLCLGCTPTASSPEPAKDAPPQEPVAGEPGEDADIRTIRLHYRAIVPPRSEPAHVWLPLPVDAEGQRVLELTTEGPDGERWSGAHGNAAWHVLVEASDAPVELGVVARVERAPLQAALDLAEARPLTAAERVEHADALAASAKVPIGEEDPILAPVLADVRAKVGDGALPVTARTIYDHVIDTMEYKKVGTGWGHGDTYWACSEKYGNCTDFHSLYLSLARTEGIPARFEMGFPIPPDRASGAIGGYHCWLQLWLPGAGWIPLDASEADKHPDQRDALYGAFPADRVLFTRGRDLRLGPDHRGESLNYFIYPYAEVAGEPLEVAHEVRFEVLPRP